MTMVYHFHHLTGEFLGTDEADESPLEPGVFLIPDFATTEPPPEQKEGFIRVFLNDEWGYVPVADPGSPPTETPQVTAAMVNIERDRRISAGILFEGVLYQSGKEDRENISGMYDAARDAIAAGAQPGEFSWQKRIMPEDGAEFFGWIAMDNSIVPMDAQTVIRFGQAALIKKQRLTFIARGIKDMVPIPENYTNDQYWG